MKMSFSKLNKVSFSVLVMSCLTTALVGQEGNFTVEIKQPFEDTIYTCPGDNIIFMAEGQNEDGSAFDPNQVVFTWDFGYNGTNKDGNTLTFSYPEGGYYEVKLIAVSQNGQAAQNVPSLSVYVAMSPNFTGTRSDRTSFCSGEPLTLTGFVESVPWSGEGLFFENSYNPSGFVWSGANIVSDRHGVARAEPPLNEGHLNYLFRVEDDFGCFHDTTLTLYGVYAEYSMDPITGEAPLEVNLSIDSSSNGGSESAIQYKWESYELSLDTTNLIFDTDGILTLERPGEYITRMIASYDQCSYRYGHEQVIQVDSSLLEIPNVFTPNEDGANDFFQVKGVSLQSMDAKVFNRWGKLVYEWQDWKALESGWNGKHMGTGGDLPSGTYYYVIKAVGWDWDYTEEAYKQYKNKIYTGSVTLLR